MLRSLMLSGPTSSSHWWNSYFSSVILQSWRLRGLSTDPLCHLHCTTPTFWGGMYFLYPYPNLPRLSLSLFLSDARTSFQAKGGSQPVMDWGWDKDVLLLLATFRVLSFEKKETRRKEKPQTLMIYSEEGSHCMLLIAWLKSLLVYCFLHR